MFPWPSDACHSAVGEQMASLIGRKVKVYEWPPQSDPELEKKRKRAIKAFKNRMRGSQQEEEQYMKLDTLTQEVSHLQKKNTHQQTMPSHASLHQSPGGFINSPNTMVESWYILPKILAAEEAAGVAETQLASGNEGVDHRQLSNTVVRLDALERMRDAIRQLEELQQDEHPHAKRSGCDAVLSSSLEADCAINLDCKSAAGNTFNLLSNDGRYDAEGTCTPDPCVKRLLEHR
ncbi:hypothetical protein Hamer_G019266 [Homarus americanus]|uniref:Uncharacterized protein n=1 Tax=Homarus americanus TaxID=6706 RepID=A0A8J5JE11_HOMAM|nr:hypothetical protein Hamer_G019266 [Homarus americanus]